MMEDVARLPVKVAPPFKIELAAATPPHVTVLPKPEFKVNQYPKNINEKIVRELNMASAASDRDILPALCVASPGMNE